MIQMRHEYLESIDSTNNEIKRRAVAGETEGLVISAGKQTAGRGRSGHQWETPADISIATSLLLRPTVAIDHLSSLTLVAAVAVRRAIEELYGIETWIKWPNDVIIHGKKVCGILTEMSASEGKAEYVVVGIGVNVHQTSFSEELADKAISVDMALKEQDPFGAKRGDCKELTYRIWQEFALLYERLLHDRRSVYRHGRIQSFSDQPQCQRCVYWIQTANGKVLRVVSTIGQTTGRDQGEPAAGGFRRGLSPGCLWLCIERNIR